LYLGIILLFVAAYGDVTTLTIPNLLVAAVALLGIIRLIVIGNIKIAVYTVGVSFLVFIAGAVIFAHGFIGGGDVKLITAMVLLIGYRDSIGFLLLRVICGAVECVIARTATIPYGVAIAIAGSIMLLIRPASNKTAGVNSIDPKSVEPKPNPKLNFVSKHRRGEYSLPRSFWVHGVLLGFLLLVVSCVLIGIRLYSGSPFFSMISMIGIGIWQIGGVWRSAKRQGGFWAKAANFCIVGILLAFMGNFADTLARDRAPTRVFNMPGISPIPADSKFAANSQPWKQVGEWEIRYDYLDAGDGTPSGCFMARAYEDLGLRIGVRGPNYYIRFTSGNLSPIIEDRKHYNLSLSFGGFTPCTIKTKAKTFTSGNKSLVFSTSDQRFFGERVTSNSLTISQSGTSIFEFTVTGAKEALAAMLNCQEAHLRNPNKSS
jgi:prepilin peptidase CpaA